MSSQPAPGIGPLLPGAIMALLAISLGFVLGGAFGAIEHSIKDHLRSSADAVFETVYEGNSSKRKSVVRKSWSYMKRAHLHGGAIGSAALASIVLLGLLGDPGRLERFSALAFGAGSLLYPVFWLSVALTAPGLGSTGEAKEALRFLAIPGAGFCILGVLGTLASALKRLGSSGPASPS